MDCGQSVKRTEAESASVSVELTTWTPLTLTERWRMAPAVQSINPTQMHAELQSPPQFCSGRVALRWVWPAGRIYVCLLDVITPEKSSWLPHPSSKMLGLGGAVSRSVRNIGSFLLGWDYFYSLTNCFILTFFLNQSGTFNGKPFLFFLLFLTDKYHSMNNSSINKTSMIPPMLSCKMIYVIKPKTYWRECFSPESVFLFLLTCFFPVLTNHCCSFGSVTSPGIVWNYWHKTEFTGQKCERNILYQYWSVTFQCIYQELLWLLLWKLKNINIYLSCLLSIVSYFKIWLFLVFIIV